MNVDEPGMYPDEEWEEFKKIPIVAEFLKHFDIPLQEGNDD